MEVEFKDLTLDDKEIINSYLSLSNSESCEYNFNTMYIWNSSFKTKYYATDEFLVFLNEHNGEYYTIMPLCSEENHIKAFEFIYKVFNEQLNKKLVMYAVDENFSKSIKKEYKDKFNIKKDKDNFDYIYDGENLRRLKGKKFNKKRNHVNGFLRDYKDNYEYRRLTSNDLDEVNECLEQWNDNKDENLSKRLKTEAIGISNIIKNIEKLDVKASGVWIDNKLEAFTIGSYGNTTEQAIIHIEKANANIRGLYNFINQLFLLKEYTEVDTVNREDDLGIPGIRKAKMSYRPIRFVRKYNIIEI
ncbi:hypothetical protein EDC19_1274 [Natranaerovirga hydrolytica]|uniref:Phosphatidylglycerol lysyltransferase C-terminal domain-containing protein n=1 Tax=Natranaerovirga hydrolytica TaxID=680378 RepID=A0A4R1N1N9_9FIRM|nr:phosphatidylglycerol lysyltransferase domain-containing protein [Natranaerovirga hydrolytica]TCK98832.1 hypothetical protein EDC19_1274 [Natranaerovirga hydrolytica]